MTGRGRESGYSTLGTAGENSIKVNKLDIGLGHAGRIRKASGKRCRIGAHAFVAGVSGRPRGAPRITGDDTICSTWFP
jgi:hypothetical protein